MELLLKITIVTSRHVLDLFMSHKQDGAAGMAPAWLKLPISVLGPELRGRGISGSGQAMQPCQHRSDEPAGAGCELARLQEHPGPSSQVPSDLQQDPLRARLPVHKTQRLKSHVVCISAFILRSCQASSQTPQACLRTPPVPMQEGN